MSYLEELLPEFRKGAKIRRKEWDNQSYYYYEKNFIWNQDIELVSFDSKDVMADDWELYQEPIDWDYIIKNKCLCWFWDDDEKHKVKIMNTLFELSDELIYKYKTGNKDFCMGYKNCRPVRKDEVTFYEDRKDEL